MDKNQARELIAKYNSGNASEAEMAIVENWYVQLKYEAEAPAPEAIVQAKDKIWRTLPLKEQKAKHMKFWPLRIVAAASVLIVLGIGIYYLLQNSNTSNSIATKYIADIAPGRNGATLSLSNGKEIRLTDASNGELAKEAGVTIVKTTNGQLVYQVSQGSGSLQSTRQSFNTLSTANGEQFQVILPDLSRVWLNAASSITYPASFSGLASRTVVLTGEAYFEISKDKQHPFIVKSAGQYVKVLGTHFNINAYTNEPVVTTTLLAGSININGKMISPGEQAVLSGKSISINEVDTDLAIAWKKGLFFFDQTPLEAVLRQVSRWYNVEIVYQNESVKQRTIGGTVTRYGNVSQILEAIAAVGNVKFEIKDKTIIVK